MTSSVSFSNHQYGYTSLLDTPLANNPVIREALLNPIGVCPTYLNGTCKPNCEKPHSNLTLHVAVQILKGGKPVLLLPVNCNFGSNTNRSNGKYSRFNKNLSNGQYFVLPRKATAPNNIKKTHFDQNTTIANLNERLKSLYLTMDHYSANRKEGH